MKTKYVVNLLTIILNLDALGDSASHRRSLHHEAASSIQCVRLVCAFEPEI